MVNAECVTVRIFIYRRDCGPRLNINFAHCNQNVQSTIFNSCISCEPGSLALFVTNFNCNQHSDSWDSRSPWDSSVGAINATHWLFHNWDWNENQRKLSICHPGLRVASSDWLSPSTALVHEKTATQRRVSGHSFDHIVLQQGLLILGKHFINSCLL